MTYQLTTTDVIICHNDDGSTSFIPNDSRNREWVAYQAWLVAVDGNGDSLNNHPEAAE